MCVCVCMMSYIYAGSNPLNGRLGDHVLYGSSGLTKQRDKSIPAGSWPCT